MVGAACLLARDFVVFALRSTITLGLVNPCLTDPVVPLSLLAPVFLLLLAMADALAPFLEKLVPFHPVNSSTIAWIHLYFVGALVVGFVVAVVA